MSNPIEKALAWFNKLPTWQKVALGVAILGVAVGGGVKAVVNLNQGDSKFKALPLGHGGTSIGAGGCILTCVTMAANSLAGKSLTVPEANEIGKANKCFANGAGEVGKGTLLIVGAPGKNVGIAPLVGLKVLDQCVAAGIKRAKEVVDAGLAKKGQAILHVGYQNDGTGDHFILITGKTAGGYIAADPATGKNIQLDNLLVGKSGSKTYFPVSARSLVKA